MPVLTLPYSIIDIEKDGVFIRVQRRTDCRSELFCIVMLLSIGDYFRDGNDLYFKGDNSLHKYTIEQGKEVEFEKILTKWKLRKEL